MDVEDVNVAKAVRDGEQIAGGCASGSKRSRTRGLNTLGLNTSRSCCGHGRGGDCGCDCASGSSSDDGE